MLFVVQFCQKIARKIRENDGIANQRFENNLKRLTKAGE